MTNSYETIENHLLEISRWLKGEDCLHTFNGHDNELHKYLGEQYEEDISFLMQTQPGYKLFAELENIKLLYDAALLEINELKNKLKEK